MGGRSPTASGGRGVKALAAAPPAGGAPAALKWPDDVFVGSATTRGAETGADGGGGGVPFALTFEMLSKERSTAGGLWLSDSSAVTGSRITGGMSVFT